MKRLIICAVTAAIGGGVAVAQQMPPPMPDSFLRSDLGNSQTLTQGEDIYDYWCAACHNMGKPGAVAVMTIRGEQIPIGLNQSENLDADYVRYLVRNGQAAMPHFRPTQISSSQLDALAEYLASPAE